MTYIVSSRLAQFVLATHDMSKHLETVNKPRSSVNHIITVFIGIKYDTA